VHLSTDCTAINLLSETRYGIETVHTTLFTPHESHGDLREEVEGETVSFTRPKKARNGWWCTVDPLPPPDASRHTHHFYTVQQKDTKNARSQREETI
jgi:hypothetical protein